MKYLLLNLLGGAFYNLVATEVLMFSLEFESSNYKCFGSGQKNCTFHIKTKLVVLQYKLEK